MLLSRTKHYFIGFTFLIISHIFQSCNSNENKKEEDNHTTRISKNENIPDSIVQFLITSAANDFNTHHPPTVETVRNVKIGYIESSDKEKTYLLCGEFLAKENKNEWVNFTTIKTSGYEQYLGNNAYCEEAIFVLTDEKLSLELQQQLNAGTPTRN